MTWKSSIILDLGTHSPLWNIVINLLHGYTLASDFFLNPSMGSEQHGRVCNLNIQENQIDVFPLVGTHVYQKVSDLILHFYNFGEYARG